MSRRAARWERTRFLRRRFVHLEVRGRVLVTAGGRVGAGDGWATKSVADSDAEAQRAYDLMVEDYRSRGYREAPVPDPPHPILPEEMFDPENG